jgi:hypothetical protein
MNHVTLKKFRLAARDEGSGMNIAMKLFYIADFNARDGWWWTDMNLT